MPKPKLSRRTSICVAISLGFLGFLVALVVARIALDSLFTTLAPTQSRKRIENPKEEFLKYTNIDVSLSTVVLSEDTHGGMHGDGEMVMVFELSEDAIRSILKSPAPWNAGDWKSGPIPLQITTRITPRPILDVSNSSIKKQNEPSFYAVLNRSPDDRANWSNGDILIIDMRKKRIVLCVWDY